MAIQVIKRKPPIIIPIEDNNGEVHEITLPGSVSIAAMLKMEELNNKDTSDDLTGDALVAAVSVIVGEDNAELLIHDLQVNETELADIITAWIEEIGNRNNSKNAVAQSQAQKNQRTRKQSQ